MVIVILEADYLQDILHHAGSAMIEIGHKTYNGFDTYSDGAKVSWRVLETKKD